MVDAIDPARKPLVMVDVHLGYNAQEKEFHALLPVRMDQEKPTIEIDGFMIEFQATHTDNGSFALNFSVAKPDEVPWLTSWALHPANITFVFEGYRSGHIWKWPHIVSLSDLPVLEQTNVYLLTLWEA